MSFLAQTINEKIKENASIEDEVLNRLQLLRTLNLQVEEVYKAQNNHLGELEAKLKDKENQHQDIIENDQEKIQAEAKLKELEKHLQVLRVEVETANQQNEKLRIQKDERLTRDLNSRFQADHKPNEQMREQLSEIIVKRHDQIDRERDFNRDIFQFSKDYKRKVDEYNALLETHAKERNDLNIQLQSLGIDLVSERALQELNTQKQEKTRVQIDNLKESIKGLEKQIDDKKKQGEDIYNQMRDQVSQQEDKIRITQEESIRLKG